MRNLVLLGFFFRNTENAAEIKSMFEQRSIEKIYMAVTSGVPCPYSGSVVIPIDIDDRSRGYVKVGFILFVCANFEYVNIDTF